MKICVLGLGYVGITSSLCFAKMGNQVWGVDLDSKKIKKLSSNEFYFPEKDLNELYNDDETQSNLFFLDSLSNIPNNIDIFLICVGTPSSQDGSLSIKYLNSALEDVLSHLNHVDSTNHNIEIVVRSTILPGTLNSIIDRKNQEIPVNCEMLYHPEFLREGTSVYDFNNPPKIVIGMEDASKITKLEELYKRIESKIFKTTVQNAECVKYLDNIFHALKVTFANEVGDYCSEKGLDTSEIMSIFKSDTKLNISEKYLNPGFAYGGSCLPKDLDAFLFDADGMNLDIKLISSIRESNNQRILEQTEKISSMGFKYITFFGLAFKESTDDLRVSPYLLLAYGLAKKSHIVSYVDDGINIDDIFSELNRLNLNVEGISFNKIPSSTQISSDGLVICSHQKFSQRCVKFDSVIYLN